jgi:hypothetical protein
METIVHEEIAKPDWTHWGQIVEATLQDAVALSCDIDPEAFHRGINGAPLDRYFKRFEIARNHRQAGHLRIEFRVTAFGNVPMVALLDFARWAEGLGWTLPDGFPRPPVASQDLASRWPWGTHETKLLRELAAAAQQFWTSYESLSPATAPTSEEVEDWLIARGIVAKRVAEVMAQMLRADDLRPGPHVNR